MKDIKEELRNVILDVMLPETKTYLEELNKTIENKTSTKDEIEAKSDMQSFIAELNTILNAIEKNKISEEDAQNVFEKITTMLEGHAE